MGSEAHEVSSSAGNALLMAAVGPAFFVRLGQTSFRSATCNGRALDDGSLLLVVGTSAGGRFQGLQQLQPLRLVCRHKARPKPVLHMTTTNLSDQIILNQDCPRRAPWLAAVLCSDWL